MSDKTVHRVRATLNVVAGDCRRHVAAIFVLDDTEKVVEPVLLTVEKMDSGTGQPSPVLDKVEMTKHSDEEWRYDISNLGLGGSYCKFDVETMVNVTTSWDVPSTGSTWQFCPSDD